MASGCYVGAIRWDAYYDTVNQSGAKGTRATLGNSQYRARAPFYATEVNRARIRYAPTQATMDAEIAYAVAGGLSYWAFLLYGFDPSQMIAYDLYQSSSHKADIKWCMMRQTYDWGTTGDYTAKVAEATAQALQPHYQRVLVNRPLVYIFYTAADITNYWSGDIANMKAAVDQFRADVQAGGAGNPYIVVVSTAQQYVTAKAGLGADAVSGYIASFTQRSDAAYALLAADTSAYWSTQAATGAMIPVVMAGWNRQPRIARPVPWEVASQKAYIGIDTGVFQLPTPAELASHVQAAIDFVDAHPTECDTRAILIYAWNECDEGGWLIPTLGDLTGERLAAIAPVSTF